MNHGHAAVNPIAHASTPDAPMKRNIMRSLPKRSASSLPVTLMTGPRTLIIAASVAAASGSPTPSACTLPQNTRNATIHERWPNNS